MMSKVRLVSHRILVPALGGGVRTKYSREEKVSQKADVEKGDSKSVQLGNPGNRETLGGSNFAASDSFPALP